MGVRTKVIPALKARRLEPIFQVTEDYVKTTIKKSKDQSDLINVATRDESAEEREKDRISGQEIGQSDLIKDLLKKYDDLINTIRANPGSDYQTLADKVAVSEATVKRHIQKLKRAGILQRKGSRKTGRWEVLEP